MNELGIPLNSATFHHRHTVSSHLNFQSTLYVLCHYPHKRDILLIRCLRGIMVTRKKGSLRPPFLIAPAPQWTEPKFPKNFPKISKNFSGICPEIRFVNTVTLTSSLRAQKWVVTCLFSSYLVFPDFRIRKPEIRCSSYLGLILGPRRTQRYPTCGPRVNPVLDSSLG